jgi:ornithine cyclodeaminase/alanine dehydrogenase-like protein (mu-crystallin family)
MAIRSIDDHEIRASIPMTAAVSAVRAALRDLGAGFFDLPPRIHHADGSYLVMSAVNSRVGSAVAKTLSVSDGRSPTIVGSATWTSVSSPDVVVADAVSMTALRTGAIVGVATDLLAAREASRLVLYGAGGLAADQVRAVHAVRPLSELTVVAPSAARAGRLAAALEGELPEVRISVCRPGGEDLRRAEIICCATPATSPLFHCADLPADVHVNAVGSYRPEMRELPDELIDLASVLAVDDLDACLAESGEIIRARRRGMETRRFTPLHELLDGPVDRTGRTGRTGRTVFKSVGLAVQDWALMDLLARRLGVAEGSSTT